MSDAPSTAPPAVSPLRRFLRTISSPWIAMTLLFIAFVHQAVGSALYKVRQAFEVNEMEWFNGPASLVLWTVICLCLMTASLVRVPWTWRKAGTHITHLGVVLLVITCTIYFAYKKEGDAILVRHYIHVQSEDGACRLLPNTGYSAPLGLGTATVQGVMPRWTILSKSGESEQAWAVMVEIKLLGADPFTATLIEGRPDLTQYTKSGRQPTSFLSDVSGVVANEDGVQVTNADGTLALKTSLRVGAKQSEKVADGERSLEIDNITPDFPLLAEGFQGRSGTMVEWTYKSPLGQQKGSSIVGEPTLTRFQNARVKESPDKRLSKISLESAPEVMAYNKDRPAIWVRKEEAARQRDPMVPMRSVDANDVIPLPIIGLPRYHDHGTHIDGGKPLDVKLGVVNNIEFTVTGFSPYARLTSRWRDDESAPVNPILDVRMTSSSDGEPFDRVVGATTDVEALREGPLLWLHCADEAAYAKAMALLDEMFPKLEQESDALATEETASQTRLAFISTSGKPITLFLGVPGKNLMQYPLQVGDSVTVPLWGDDLTFTLRNVLQRPKKVVEPLVVPKEQQQSRMSVGDYESLVQITATYEGRTSRVWVPYSPYPHLPRDMGNGSSLGMYAPRPVMIDVEGAGRFELCYSKAPMPMPGKIWMTGFEVPRRPGSDDPSEFFCYVGYGDESAPQAAKIHMNYPLQWQDTFFFQASWDPSAEALTVLGVGNRPAGAAMLWASIVLALGMAWSGFMAAFAGRKP